MQLAPALPRFVPAWSEAGFPASKAEDRVDVQPTSNSQLPKVGRGAGSRCWLQRVVHGRVSGALARGEQALVLSTLMSGAPDRTVVIVGAARTPIGRYGGAFRSVHPTELGAVAVRAALGQAGVDPASVDEVFIGHARQAGSGPNPARQVVRRSGLPDAVPAQTINKACAS